MENDKKIEAIRAFHSKNYEKTIIICKDIIKSNKQTSEIYNIYGLALQEKRLVDESKEQFKIAIELNPNNFEALNNYAISLSNTSELDLAEEVYLKALKIKPNYINAIFNLGKLNFKKKKYNEAIKLYLKALEIPTITFTEKIFIQQNLSITYSTLGKFIEAKLYSKKTLEIDKNNLQAIKVLSELTDHKKDKSILKKMEDILRDPNLTISGKVLLFFELGRVYDELKNYKYAYNYFDKANKIKKKLTKSPLSNIQEIKNNVIKSFKNLKFSEFKKISEKQKAIFIIGLPRSGTTLIEQIISSHKEVLATGESTLLRAEIYKLFYKIENKTHKNREFDFNLFLKEKSLNDNILQKKYFESLKKKNLTSNIYTDKSLENFLFIGFIKIFFPKSKIIITRRDKKDVYLSIFKNNFLNPYMNWSYDKKDILEYYNIYSEMISFWEDLISDDLYTVEYEDLLENPESEIRELIKFCDLSWDPMCLQHENNISGIETASVMQARKPIYKTSKKSFNNYSKYFSDIFSS